MIKSEMILKPTFGYWISTKIGFILLVGTITLLASSYMKIHMALQCVGFIIAIGCLMYSFYKFIDMLIFTKWVITEEQIKIYRGILFRSINYIELYRVYDYQQKQSLIQTLIGNVTIYIYSGDKSNPTLKIYGVPEKMNVIQDVRNKVELQKERKGIYEFTNR